MIENIIQSIGLNQKEASVYLTTLKLGLAKVGDIAKLSKINRVSCYDILEKLLKRGYISQTEINGVQQYEAISPDTIYQQQKEKTENLKRALPELKKFQRLKSHPLVRYFEGIEGIKSIYADTLTTKSEILSFANSAEIRNFWPEYDQEYVAQRVKKKIFLRGIAINDETGIRVNKENKKYFRHIKLVNKKDFNFANEINIYDNKVAYTSFGLKPMGIIIEDEGLAATQRSIFEMLFKIT